MATNRDYGKTRSTDSVGYKKPVVARFADGGDVEEGQMKQAGLKATEGESVGFFERLRAGNIDDPKSEAYSRWGAGAGRRNAASAASEGESEDYTHPAKAEAPKPAASTAGMDERDARDEARAASTYKQTDDPKPAAKPTAVAKPASRRGVTPLKDWKVQSPSYSNEGRNHSTPTVSRNSSALGGAIDRAKSAAQTRKPSLLDKVMSGAAYKRIDDSGKDKYKA